ncbi:methyltransferase [Paenibacillus sp. CCS19]|uniref:class I SAM-dependent methyltransferase n=1 Tax=Paenibacillus sp. CCS19 TaxID=3158387 RepID=UPI002566C21F|nr:class I SAM-dependent methyltransferase [Paenibacillus cellulosilyticus]GMK41599.1 methyltransferase [Paenibacillus cellulosilyticus]
MKQNKYDDQTFFSAYEQMPRSIDGLKAAGEWHVLQALLPELSGKRVLDLGCGFGWHCRYAREQQASEVVGVDISANMLKRAQEMTDDPRITYLNRSIEEIDFEKNRFDVVISSLAFHYIQTFDDVCAKVYDCMAPEGTFLFSVEHPIFTARDEQDWIYDEKGNRLHWPVDRYQSEGLRDTSFLTDHVIKYHRTVSTYMNSLIQAGFRIAAVKEPEPSAAMMHIPGMKDELRRPMFLIIAAVK